MLRRASLATVLCASFLGATAAPVAPSRAAAGPNGAFAPVLPALRRTHIPLHLPAYLPGRYYASVLQARTGYYEIALGFTKGCLGGACAFGTVYGQRLPSRAMEGEGVSDTGHLVQLATGIHGRFHAFTCGASCGESTVTWIQGQYRYAIGVKAGSQARTVRIADSAIVTTGM